MSFRWIPILFLLLALRPAAAQIELNPYLGFSPGDDRLSLPATADNPAESFEGHRYFLGADALFGANQLAPLAGAVYVHQRYSGSGGTDFSYGRIQIPLGLAYRLLAPDFDINLVPSLAVVPGLNLGTSAAPAFQRDLDVSLRAAVRLYLDDWTLGTQYWWNFTDHYPAGAETPAGWVLTAGMRF